MVEITGWDLSGRLGYFVTILPSFTGENVVGI